ncbi:MAG: glycosyltransferase family 2 protein, partial [Lachnospiraceae bacterium]|nr:glycosyltransferase family 2 protein [Lachnospiraceae bacterium]
MEKPIVSIVISVYNAEKYLRECLDSVFEQEYENIEVIVIDDGSTDYSLEVCNTYCDERLHIYSQENHGLPYSRKRGIERSHGDWILFVDSDDLLHKKIISDLISNLKPGVDLVMFHTSKRENGKTNFVRSFPEGIPDVCDNPMDNFFSGDFAYGLCWGKLYRAAFLKEHGLSADNTRVIGEDRDFNYFVLKKVKRIQYYDNPYGGYVYRVNSQSESRKYSEKLIQDYISLIKTMAKRFPEKNNDEDFNKWGIALVRMAIVNGFFSPGNPQKYRKKKKRLSEMLKILEISHLMEYLIFCDHGRKKKKF